MHASMGTQGLAKHRHVHPCMEGNSNRPARAWRMPPRPARPGRGWPAGPGAPTDRSCRAAGCTSAPWISKAWPQQPRSHFAACLPADAGRQPRRSPSSHTIHHCHARLHTGRPGRARACICTHAALPTNRRVRAAPVARRRRQKTCEPLIVRIPGTCLISFHFK